MLESFLTPNFAVDLNPHLAVHCLDALIPIINMHTIKASNHLEVS